MIGQLPRHARSRIAEQATNLLLESAFPNQGMRSCKGTNHVTWRIALAEKETSDRSTVRNRHHMAVIQHHHLALGSDQTVPAEIANGSAFCLCSPRSNALLMHLQCQWFIAKSTAAPKNLKSILIAAATVRHREKGDKSHHNEASGSTALTADPDPSRVSQQSKCSKHPKRKLAVDRGWFVDVSRAAVGFESLRLDPYARARVFHYCVM